MISTMPPVALIGANTGGRGCSGTPNANNREGFTIWRDSNVKKIKVLKHLA